MNRINIAMLLIAVLFTCCQHRAKSASLQQPDALIMEGVKLVVKEELGSVSDEIANLKESLENFKKELHPFVTGTCDTSGKDIWAPSYLIMCPSNCNSDTSKVIGTGIYSEDSSLCKAAIHSGIIMEEMGGPVEVMKYLGISEYIGSPANGVTSVDGGLSLSSFTLSEPFQNGI